MKNFKQFLNESADSLGKTKVLWVYGSDYAALSFQDVHKGSKVIDIINNPQDYSPGTEDEGDWELKVYEFEGKIDPQFVDFVRNQVQDYDSSKHEYFYLENEEIG